MKPLDIIKKQFKDKDLFEQALTHKSWLNENKGKRKSNERLEFLGDAVLEFIVSDDIYQKFPDKEEGYLTDLRANLVNTKNLANLARKLKIGEEIYMSKGEKKSVGHDNDAVLADTLEAIMGAIYIDAGLEKVKEFIDTNLLPDIEEKIKVPLKHAKNRLQELVQSRDLPVPYYRVLTSSGPAHNKLFISGVFIGHEKMAEGKGKSKIEAEEAAAVKALEKLETKL